MGKIQFPTSVKYNGVKYAAHTPFEVDDKDLPSLIKDGGWLIKTAEVAVPPKGKGKGGKKDAPKATDADKTPDAPAGGTDEDDENTPPADDEGDDKGSDDNAPADEKPPVELGKPIQRGPGSRAATPKK